MEKGDKKFLSTHKNWDLAAQLNELVGDQYSVCLIRIQPRSSKTGLNKERGQWIKRFWDSVIKKIAKIDGHRIGWSDVVFFTPCINGKHFEESILELVKHSLADKLLCTCVFSTITGSVNDMIKEIDKMYLQLSKLNYWDNHLYSSVYIDGEKVKLNKS